MPKRGHARGRSIPLFGRAFGDAGQAIAITASDVAGDRTRLLFVNRAFEQLTGWPGEAVVGRRCAEIYGRTVDAAPIDAVATVALRFAGRECVVEIQRAALFDRAGTPRYCLIVHRPQGGGRQSAPEQAGTLGGLIDELGHGVLVRRGFQAVYANRACAERLAVGSVDELVDGPSLLRFLPLELHGRALDYDARLMAGEVSAHPRAVGSSGRK